MRRILLVIIIGAVWIPRASAQDGENWTLQQCVQTALDNNLNVKRSVYNVENFRIARFQSEMALLPTLNTGGSYGKNFGRALNPVTNQYVNRNSNTINVQATSSLTLFNGFRLQSTLRQSFRDYDASNQDLLKAKNDVIINVVTLYINVIFNQELYDNANYQLESSQRQLERIVKQVEAGALPKGDQLNQEATVATNEVNLVNQENTLNLSLLQLKQAMQVPSSTSMRVVAPPLEPEDLILDETPETVYAMAEKTMPEIKSAILKVQSAELAMKAAKGSLYPRLSLNAAAQSNYSSASDLRSVPDGNTVPQQIGYTSGGDQVFTLVPTYAQVPYPVHNQLKDNIFKTANLQLTIPLFNGWQNRASVQRAYVSQEIANIAEKEARNTLRQTIETSYNNALAAAKTYSSSLKQVSAREEAWRMAQQRFEFGALNYFEYQITENNLYQAKSDLARAKYNFIFRKKILDFYQGKPIDY